MGVERESGPKKRFIFLESSSDQRNSSGFGRIIERWFVKRRGYRLRDTVPEEYAILTPIFPREKEPIEFEDYYERNSPLLLRWEGSDLLPY